MNTTLPSVLIIVALVGLGLASGDAEGRDELSDPVETYTVVKDVRAEDNETEDDRNVIEKVWDWVKEEGTSLPEQIWEFFVNKIVGGIKWIFSSILSALDSLAGTWMDFWETQVRGGDWSTGNDAIDLSMQMIMVSALIMGVFALVRLWVWLLDVFPMV